MGVTKMTVAMLVKAILNRAKEKMLTKLTSFFVYQ